MFKIAKLECSAAALFLLFELFACAELLRAASGSGLLGSSRLRSGSHIRLDLTSHCLEGLVNILARLGRGLQESN